MFAETTLPCSLERRWWDLDAMLHDAGQYLLGDRDCVEMIHEAFYAQATTSCV